MELYITRHGQSAGNFRVDEGLIVAELSFEEKENPPLTPLGKRQAELLGERMAECELDAVIVSPLLRAVETAYEIAARQRGSAALRMELMPEMMEVGAPEGYRGTEAQRLCALFADVNFSYIETEQPIFPCALEHSPERNVASEQKLRRAQNIIDYIRKRFPGDERVMLVAHGTLNHSLIAAATGIVPPVGFNFCCENTGLTKVRYSENGRVRLSFMDDVSHLIPEFPHHTFSL